MARRLLKHLERSYGFDEVAIVPGEVTINPEMTSTQMSIGEFAFDSPVLASAMDGSVSPRFATLMHEMGGLGVLNGEGLYTRYEDPYSVLEEIISMDQSEVTEFLQQVYSEPVQEHLIGQRVGGNQKHRCGGGHGVYAGHDQEIQLPSRRSRSRHHSGAVNGNDCPAYVAELHGPDFLGVDQLAEGSGRGW